MAHATLERKRKGFWLNTKPAENKHKWTYWNITSLSVPEKWLADPAVTAESSYLEGFARVKKRIKLPPAMPS